MFAPKIAKAGAKASASSTTALAPRHSSLATRPFDGAELEHGPSWDFAKIPLFPSERVQPKLTVGAVDDPLEREADRVADQAMGQSGVAVPLASPPASGQTDQSSADVSGIVERGLSGGGQPLPAPVRTELEPKFGLDFGKIRIHADSSASRSAHELSAKAYTVGPDIVFRAGAYAPGNADGKRLLAHELAHVAQQGAAAKFARTASVQPARSTVSAALPVRPAVNWGVVQRQASSAAIPAAGGPTTDYSKMSWEELLPHAHGAKAKKKKATEITKVKLHPEPGIKGWQAPALEYVPEKKIQTDPAPAAPKGGVGETNAAESKAFADAEALAISQIIVARSKIPHREMKPSERGKPGYDYDPVAKAAGEYNQWAESALPTGMTKDKNGNVSDWRWAVFKWFQKPRAEGKVGTITTFDRTLTVGPGFSSKGGQAQNVIGKTFKLLSEIESVAFAAGLSVDADGTMKVVDTDKKWILDGQDAAAYVETNVSLLSLLVNVSQGVQPVDTGADASPSWWPSFFGPPPVNVGQAAPLVVVPPSTIAPVERDKQRQALLDAEWQQFVDGTLLGIDSLVQRANWATLKSDVRLKSAILAAHAKHSRPGIFGYSFWTDQNSPDLEKMVAAIYEHASSAAHLICTTDDYAPILKRYLDRKHAKESAGKK
jgi:Domain of unknown function (DUF4157)